MRTQRVNRQEALRDVPASCQHALQTAAITISYSCLGFWAQFLALPVSCWDSEKRLSPSFRGGFKTAPPFPLLPSDSETLRHRGDFAEDRGSPLTGLQVTEMGYLRPCSSPLRSSRGPRLHAGAAFFWRPPRGGVGPEGHRQDNVRQRAAILHWAGKTDGGTPPANWQYSSMGGRRGRSCPKLSNP